MDEKTAAIGEIIPAPASVQPAPADPVRLDASATVRGPEQFAAMVREWTGLALPGVSDGPATLTLDLGPGFGPEGYGLEVGAGVIALRATDPAGLFYAVQTLCALLTGPDWIVPGGRITDQPRLAYRGLMLDVARHFFAPAQVRRLIDLAARYKLNHLHLHLTDDQGWRIAVSSWPRLASHGGGTEVGGGPGGYYSQDDYRGIVAYAASRFITVVPEIDLPGHTNAALASYPELNPDGVAPDRYTGIGVGFSSLDVASEGTYAFLDEVFAEIAALTPGPYLHIGGDEAKTLAPDEYARIVERAQELVARHGKTVIGWHEIAAARLAPSTVVQYWGATPEAPASVLAAAAQGNRIIMSPADRAYLDMQYDEDSPLGLAWAGYVSVRRSYEWDPVTHVPGLDPAAVLGLECPLWTETATTPADLEYLAFPRLAALAELGWSTADSRDWESFRRRLGAQAPAWAALGLRYYASPEIDWLDADHDSPDPRPRTGAAD